MLEGGSVLTRQTPDVHLFQVLCFQDANGELPRSGYIPQRDADISQLLWLLAQGESRGQYCPIAQTAIAVPQSTCLQR